jgi:uncharacterized protein YndB with AHSA1/START domain
MVFKILAGLLTCLALFVFVARKVSSPVHVERVFNAPVAKVWAMWNDPETMKKWWSPRDYTAPVVQNDLRVGGKFLLSMRSPKGEMFWNTGTYKEVVANQRIVSSLSFSDESGKVLPGARTPVPGQWPDEITLTVDFRDEGGRTRVHVEEVGIPLIMKLLATMGWEQQMDKLEALL